MPVAETVEQGKNRTKGVALPQRLFPELFASDPAVFSGFEADRLTGLLASLNPGLSSIRAKWVKDSLQTAGEQDQEKTRLRENLVQAVGAEAQVLQGMAFGDGNQPLGVPHFIEVLFPKVKGIEIATPEVRAAVDWAQRVVVLTQLEYLLTAGRISKDQAEVEAGWQLGPFGEVAEAVDLWDYQESSQGKNGSKLVDFTGKADPKQSLQALEEMSWEQIKLYYGGKFYQQRPRWHSREEFLAPDPQARGLIRRNQQLDTGLVEINVFHGMSPAEKRLYRLKAMGVVSVVFLVTAACVLEAWAGGANSSEPAQTDPCESLSDTQCAAKQECVGVLIASKVNPGDYLILTADEWERQKGREDVSWENFTIADCAGQGGEGKDSGQPTNPAPVDQPVVQSQDNQGRSETVVPSSNGVSVFENCPNAVQVNAAGMDDKCRSVDAPVGSPLKVPTPSDLLLGTPEPEVIGEYTINYYQQAEAGEVVLVSAAYVIGFPGVPGWIDNAAVAVITKEVAEAGVKGAIVVVFYVFAKSYIEDWDQFGSVQAFTSLEAMRRQINTLDPDDFKGLRPESDRFHNNQDLIQWGKLYERDPYHLDLDQILGKLASEGFIMEEERSYAEQQLAQYLINQLNLKDLDIVDEIYKLLDGLLGTKFDENGRPVSYDGKILTNEEIQHLVDEVLQALEDPANDGLEVTEGFEEACKKLKEMLEGSK